MDQDLVELIAAVLEKNKKKTIHSRMQRLLYCITVCYYLHMFYCKLHTVLLMLGNHKQRKPHLSILTTSINTDYKYRLPYSKFNYF